MKKQKILLGLSLVLGLQNLSASTVEEGAALFKAKCSACHITTRPTDISKLVAPPAMGITMHVKMAHPDKKAFQAFVVDYVLNPSASKSLCTKQTVKRFGVMPSQKGNVSEEELQAIASYLYENFAKGGKMMGQHRGMHKGMGGPMHGQGGCQRR